jgi:hypothetical protein
VTDLAALKSEIVIRLDAMVEATDVPPRAQTSAQTLLEKLCAPVRIGLLGLPGSGKRALLNALCDDALAGLDADWPTLELSHGPVAQTQAMLSDGGFLRHDGLPTPDLLRQEPVFLRIALPSPHLMDRVLLLVASDAAAEDLANSLRWAAPRVDLALWCSRSWTPFEQNVWLTCPDSLRAHALLVFIHGVVPVHARGNGFDAVFSVGNTPGADLDFATFAQHLADIVDEAAEQDIHAAQLFLRHYAPISAPHALAVVGSQGPIPLTGPQTGPQAVEQVGRQHAQPQAPAQARPNHAPPVLTTPLDSTNLATPDSVPQQAIPRPVSRPLSRPLARHAPQATAELARLFQLVRTSAEDLRLRLDQQGPQDTAPASLLNAFEGIFDRLADRASDLAQVEETWPDLVAQMGAARDLALLMRIEGGAEQVSDAARLLLQLRQDIEQRLAA